MSVWFIYKNTKPLVNTKILYYILKLKFIKRRNHPNFQLELHKIVVFYNSKYYIIFENIFNIHTLLNYSIIIRLITLKSLAFRFIKNEPLAISFKSNVFLESNFGTVNSLIKKPLKS